MKGGERMGMCGGARAGSTWHCCAVPESSSSCLPGKPWRSSKTRMAQPDRFTMLLIVDPPCSEGKQGVGPYLAGASNTTAFSLWTRIDSRQ